eukprot:scaffold72114_cov58-Phaeocystis_antarctica.AAC.7
MSVIRDVSVRRPMVAAAAWISPHSWMQSSLRLVSSCTEAYGTLLLGLVAVRVGDGDRHALGLKVDRALVHVLRRSLVVLEQDHANDGHEKAHEFLLPDSEVLSAASPLEVRVAREGDGAVSNIQVRRRGASPDYYHTPNTFAQYLHPLDQSPPRTMRGYRRTTPLSRHDSRAWPTERVFTAP